MNITIFMTLSFLKKLIRPLARNSVIYRIAKYLVNSHNGENNCDIYSNGEYKFLARYAKNCQIFFDVGAHTGEWTKFALALSPSSEIHCFEPSEDTFRELLNNRFPPNIICNNFGLGASRGKNTLYFWRKSSNKFFISEGDWFSADEEGNYFYRYY